MKVWIVSIWAAFVAGCASHQQVIVGCDLQPRGSASIETRRSQSGTSGPSSLAVLVHLGVPNGYPIPNVTLTLHADTLAGDVRTPLTVGHTDDMGRFTWDSLAPGVYGLLVRGIGFSVLRSRLHVRSGYRDTLLVQLREQPMC